MKTSDMTLGRSCANMTAPEFQSLVKKTGGYATPDNVRSLALPSFLSTAVFNMRMAEIYVRVYISACQPNFSSERWAACGFLVYRLVEFLGGKIKLDGFEKMEACSGPVVWVSNHMSSLETFLLPTILNAWSDLMIVLKESLAHYPFFGRVVRAVDPVRIERKNSTDDLRKVLHGGGAGLKAGRSALIFPQGRRMRRFDPATFNSLGAKLAVREGVPVVPLAVCTDFLRIGKWQKDLFATVRRSSPVRISCGNPIPAGVPQAEIQRQCREFICEKLSEWQDESGLVLL